MKKVYSFDVFDTTVSRYYAHPKDLFLELGLLISPKHYSAKKKLRLAKKFQKYRILTEKFAYFISKPHHSTTLSKIYSYIPLPKEVVLNRRFIMRAEIQLEMASTFPIPQVVSEINQRINENYRVVFISDMYLSDLVIKRILNKNGVSCSSVKVYVSSDSRATKHTGELFNTVLKSESISAPELLHFGDNSWADIYIPNSLGISTNHFAHSKLTPHEEQITRCYLAQPLACSYLAGLSRRLRLSFPYKKDPKKSPEEYEHIIFGTVAPLLVSFVNWILNDAILKGYTRLYFVARDGEILFKIAKKLLININSAIDIQYLHGSRKAWLAPSVTKGSEIWKNLLVTSGQRNTRFDIISRLGIEGDNLDKIKQILNISSSNLHTSLDSIKANSFVEELFKHPLTSDLIFNHTEYLRQQSLVYFRQKGLLDDVKWALVDIGWSLNCQAALLRILKSELGDDYSINGYYFGLGRNHLNSDIAGNSHCYIDGSGSIFSRRRVVLEHCFTPATHPSTTSYKVDKDGLAQAVFGKDVRSSYELEFAHRLHEIVLHAAEMYTSDIRIRSIINSYRNEIDNNAIRFLRFPTKSEVSLFTKFGTIADMRHESAFVQPLCGKLSFSEVISIIKVTFSIKHNFSTPAFMWLEGSAALSPYYVRIPIFLMLRMDSLLNFFRKWKSNF